MFLYFFHGIEYQEEFLASSEGVPVVTAKFV